MVVMRDALLTLLADRKPQTILVLGDSDTGKTTLMAALLTAWDAGGAVAVVDCDVGQSQIGPPTTVAWALIERPFVGWRRTAVRGMAFTGSVSPEGNLDTFLEAVGRVVEGARRQAPHLLIDTTGLVQGELGLALKRRKLSLIKPDLILALQREQELEPILADVPREIHVERLAASPDCVRRSLAARAGWRDEQFARYFANSVTHDLSFDRSQWMGIGPDWLTGKVTASPAALMARVIGLRTDQDEDLALGLVRDVDGERRRLVVLSPLRNVAAVTRLVVGSIRWPQS